MFTANRKIGNEGHSTKKKKKMYVIELSNYRLKLEILCMETKHLNLIS